MKLEGKRLLLLGATRMMATAVETAKRHGIYTIVADYYENSPGKQIADKSYLISTSDIDALLEVCQKERVDGVFFGYSEQNQNFALELAERGGYFHYATRQQVELITNKAAFKVCCQKYGVPTVPEFPLSRQCSPSEMKQLEYPIIVKPVDSFSGKGITICSGPEAVPTAVTEAVAVSPTGEFLVEKYMSDSDYDVIAVYYTIQDGEAKLSSMADRYMFTFPNQRCLNTALLYPSQYLKRYLEEVDKKLNYMLKEIGIENGTLFLEGCVNEKGFYFWEAGFRLCGAQQNIFPAYINHIDVQEMLICHALTGRMADSNQLSLEDPSFRGKSACNGLLFIRPGKLCEVCGVDAVQKIPGVISFTQLLELGAVVKESDIGTLGQSFARFHIVAENRELVFQIMDQIWSTISVLDENGDNMLITTFSFEDMRQKRRWVRNGNLLRREDD